MGHPDDSAPGFSEDDAGLGAGEKFVRLTHRFIMTQCVMSVKRNLKLISVMLTHDGQGHIM